MCRILCVVVLFLWMNSAGEAAVSGERFASILLFTFILRMTGSRLKREPLSWRKEEDLWGVIYGRYSGHYGAYRPMQHDR